MKACLWLLLPLLLVAACHPKPMKVRKAARYLLGDRHDSVTWKRMRMFDPYEGGQLLGDPGDAYYLCLRSDGSFREWDNHNRGEGRYYLNRDKNSMALAYSSFNGQIPDTSMQRIRYRYTILKLNADTFSIGQQGRHGMVEQLLLRVRE